MSKRFKNLEAALKYLRTPGAGGQNGTPPNAPVGTQLAEYQEYRAGKKVITYTRANDSKPGQLDEVKILPFAEPAASTALLFVPFSRRAQTNMTQSGVTAAALNHRTAGDANEAKGFTPARATVSIVGTGEGTPTPSKITGRSYKKKNVNTFTFPFGQGEGEKVAAKVVKADIITAVSTGGTNRSVSFKPERS